MSLKVHGPIFFFFFSSTQSRHHSEGELHINTLRAPAPSKLRRTFTTFPNTPCGFGRHSVNSSVSRCSAAAAASAPLQNKMQKKIKKKIKKISATSSHRGRRRCRGDQLIL